MANKFCFLAVVRDEEPVIERCLESIKNLATSYLLCDTGSKDNTIAKIENYMKNQGIPGVVIERPWVSYGETKSEMLKVFRDHLLVNNAEYICWLDADEVFLTNKNDPLSYPTKEDADKLYAYLNTRKENVFRMTTIYSNLVYPRWQIARNDQLYEWRLPYQEYFVGTVSTNTHDLQGWYNLARHEGNSSRDPAILDKRIEMSKGWLDRNPTSSERGRMVFYLADACVSAKRYEEAAKLYEERLELTGFFEEKYISLLKLSELYAAPDEKVLCLLKAIEFDPERLEAYYQLLMHYKSLNKFRESIAFYYAAPTTRALPNRSLFLEHAVYEYLFDLEASVSLYHSGKFKEGYELCVLLGARDIPVQHRVLLASNMNFFKQKYSPPKDITRTITSQIPLPTIMVIDNFYDQPEAVRDIALGMEYEVKGNYPGARTRSLATEEMKLKFENIIGRKITYWPDSYNGSFQYTTKDNVSWIHRDQTDFSAVIYLTPDAPLTAGTTLYRHRRLGIERTSTPEEEKTLNADGNDWSLWDPVDKVGNKFNRAIIFQGFVSHKSDDYFGTDLQTGRLFQTFFFNVEK